MFCVSILLELNIIVRMLIAVLRGNKKLILWDYINIANGTVIIVVAARLLLGKYSLYDNEVTSYLSIYSFLIWMTVFILSFVFRNKEEWEKAMKELKRLYKENPKLCVVFTSFFIVGMMIGMFVRAFTLWHGFVL